MPSDGTVSAPDDGTTYETCHCFAVPLPTGFNSMKNDCVLTFLSFEKMTAATKAIALICNFGFVELGLHRIEAGFYNSNAGSRAALIKNGFREDGVLVQQLKNDAGMYEDHVLFGLLVDEWKSHTAKQ